MLLPARQAPPVWRGWFLLVCSWWVALAPVSFGYVASHGVPARTSGTGILPVGSSVTVPDTYDFDGARQRGDGRSEAQARSGSEGRRLRVPFGRQPSQDRLIVRHKPDGGTINLSYRFFSGRKKCRIDLVEIFRVRPDWHGIL